MAGYEVGIVGAGIHGVSAAWHLASQGVRVAVFDRGGAASGPTGRSSAVCRANYTNEFLAVVARESIRMFRHFEELSGGRRAGFHQTGALYYHPSEDVDEVRDGSARLSRLGIRNEMIEADALPVRFPSLSPDGVAAALWENDAGYADPTATTVALLERAVELGAEPRLNEAVASVEPGRLMTATGSSVECERLLIAAGPWSRGLALGVGADLPLSVERRVVATFDWGRAEPFPFVLADITVGCYMKPEASRLLSLGTLGDGPESDPDDFDPKPADEESYGLLTAASKRIPALGTARLRGGWASVYDMSPDWQPVIGEIAPGVFVDAGTSGHGFKLAPALGAYVADLVLGSPDPALSQFHPDRFQEGRTLGAGYRGAKILG